MKVAVMMGSDSDWAILKPAVELLKEFEIGVIVKVASAHRTPSVVREFVLSSDEEDIGIFIVGAGAAAHLAGVVASYTTKPVIGVPINATPLNGVDALYSTVQMPSGVPVASMAINGAKNAAIFAIEIMSMHDKHLKERLMNYRERMALEVEQKSAKVMSEV